MRNITVTSEWNLHVKINFRSSYYQQDYANQYFWIVKFLVGRQDTEEWREKKLWDYQFILQTKYSETKMDQMILQMYQNIENGGKI